ncbi:MAG TPA: hypothetical protein VGK00_06635 [Anaerolineales bacterium]|jgi:hypothetical protein
MKQFDFRTWFGAGLVLLGGLMLLEKFGVLRGATGLFWGAALWLAAAYFIYMFVRAPQERWWAIIPAMALLGMGGAAILPRVFSGVGGGIFLGALGLAFIIVYLTDHARWWGLIPGGVLLTLAMVSTVGVSNAFNTGSLFFIGLGLTFLLVAVLPTPGGNMGWAYIPAAVLVLMGALLASRATAGLVDYITPTALIVVGLVVVYRFLMKKD